VQVGYFTTAADLVLHKSYTHSWQGFAPAALWRQLDLPDLVAARCPLPTLVQHNRGDALFTTGEAEEGLAQVGAAFAKAGAAESWRGLSYDGPHKFDVEMQEDALGFLERWLRPAACPAAAETGGDCPELAALRDAIAQHAASERARLTRELGELDARRADVAARLAQLPK